MASWQKPTEEQINLVIENLKGNLRQQFFSKLENPEWFDVLNERGLLWYNTNINDYGKEYKEWVAFPYLLNVASEIPDKIMELIDPILKDMDNDPEVDIWLIQNCISVAAKMPDKEFKEIINTYNKFVEKAVSIGWQNHEDFKKIIERLQSLDKHLALRLCKNILSITLKFDNDSFGSRFVTRIKLPNGGYDYSEILKITKNIFSNSLMDLLKIYISIITEKMVKNLSTEDVDHYNEVGYIRRSAIEEHPQDNYKQEDPVYLLISEIRDISLSIISNIHLAKTSEVFELLKNPNNPTMTRIILHLLRISNNCDKNILANYLTNKQLFDQPQFHYEYYHLIQDKFVQLPEEDKNIILGYIESGPEGEYYQTDTSESLTAKNKQDNWVLGKLTPIRYVLSKNIIEKYKNILFDEQGQEKIYSEHPDLLSWTNYGWGISSPLDETELMQKTIDELIIYMNSWEPDSHGIGMPEVLGLAEGIRLDASKNPNKYLDNLNKFEQIKNPTYAHYILSGLREVKDINDNQWKNIIHFGKWVSIQNQVFENKDRYRDGDKDWYGTKSCIADLLAKAFSHSANLASLDDTIISIAYDTIQILILGNDRYLDERTQKPTDYLTSAINCLHGKSVESLVNYSVWLKNNKKSLESVEEIMSAQFNNPPYMETRAIFAHTLPWLYNVFPKMVESNIDKFMPEDPNRREIFDVTWNTYLYYSRIFDSMFPVLENKFRYVLKNNLYASNDIEHNEEKRISQHLVIYYARGLFELDSDLLTLVFDSANNHREQQEFINYIGFSMWDKNGVQSIKKEIITKFMELWEWLLDRIKGKESNYKDVLAQFERWYQCDKFDRKWVLTHLHNLIVKHDITMHLFMLEEQLLEDLPKFPRMVFDIVSKLTFSKQEIPYYSHKGFLENIVEYIKNNDFQNDLTLKRDKDLFINKYLESCEPWRVDNETKKFVVYLESKK